jgi:hypothetical protein
MQVRLSTEDLLVKAKLRFSEAKILHSNGCFEGAVYLCGYALELIIKRYIAKSLNWDMFPPEGVGDLVNKAFLTHNLSQLLILSGLREEIKINLELPWQQASRWSSEMRYSSNENINADESQKFINAFRDLLNYISKKHP